MSNIVQEYSVPFYCFLCAFYCTICICVKALSSKMQLNSFCSNGFFLAVILLAAIAAQICVPFSSTTTHYALILKLFSYVQMRANIQCLENFSIYLLLFGLNVSIHQFQKNYCVDFTFFCIFRIKVEIHLVHNLSDEGYFCYFLHR